MTVILKMFELTDEIHSNVKCLKCLLWSDEIHAGQKIMYTYMYILLLYIKIVVLNHNMYTSSFVERSTTIDFDCLTWEKMQRYATIYHLRWIIIMQKFVYLF